MLLSWKNLSNYLLKWPRLNGLLNSLFLYLMICGSTASHPLNPPRVMLRALWSRAEPIAQGYCYNIQRDFKPRTKKSCLIKNKDPPLLPSLKNYSKPLTNELCLLCYLECPWTCFWGLFSTQCLWSISGLRHVGDKWVALTGHLDILHSTEGAWTATNRSFVLIPPPLSPPQGLRVEHSTLETWGDRQMWNKSHVWLSLARLTCSGLFE